MFTHWLPLTRWMNFFHPKFWMKFFNWFLNKYNNNKLASSDWCQTCTLGLEIWKKKKKGEV
jgi:hypothetical protein